MRFNKLTIIDSIVFLFVVILTLFHALFNYAGTGNLSLILMALAFNLSIGILIVASISFVVRFSKRGIRIFILYVIVVSFLYWYFISTFFNLYYGTYLSIGGLSYFIATRTYTAVLIFYLASGFVILGTTSTLYYLSRKYLFKDQIQRVVNKKIKILIFLIPIFIIIIVLLAIPKSTAFEASPLMEAFAQIILKNEPAVKQLKISQPGEKILPLSLKIKNPNFIFILMESISAERLSIYGYERETAPNLKKIADNSIIFDNAYSSSAHSDYAQTAFLSSRYTLINDYRNFFDEDYPRKFLWDILKEEGYNTAYISSQDDNWANMIDYYKKENLDYYHYSLTDEKYDYGSGNSRKDYDEITANKSLQWLKNQTKENPFYLYINFQGTHYPYEYKNNSIYFPDEPSSSTTYFNLPKSDYQASINDYDNSVNYVDKQIGKIYDYLDKNNLLKDTIIVISSDHGESFEYRNKNLRHGYGVYEEEIKVPLIFYLPGHKTRRISEPVRHVDVIPTLLDIVGFNSSPEFQGEPMRENQLIYLMTQNQNYKLGMVKGDIKYIGNMISYKTEAYNLTQDPEEKNNLASSKEGERFYYLNYGYILYNWYKCQMKYYDKELWKKGKIINC